MYTMQVKKVLAPNMASLPPKKQKQNETVKWKPFRAIYM